MHAGEKRITRLLSTTSKYFVGIGKIGTRHAMFIRAGRLRHFMDIFRYSAIRRAGAKPSIFFLTL
jgi:hypothetical protein